MNFVTLISAIAKKRFVATSQAAKPPRTAVPLRASQGSAIEIEIVPIVLATSNGALFGNIATHASIVAVGQFSLFNGNVRYYHAYLDTIEGGFLSLATQGSKIIETRLYRLYTEVNPQTSDDWAFWMDDNGYIGSPVAQSLDADGAKPFNRSWGSGDQRIPPFTPIETVLDASGGLTRLHHNMMHYSRPLTADNKIAEHLLVSAMAENSTLPTGVTFWLGIDVDPSEIKVYPAVDAPAFP